ncbi:toast rack family protein [Thermanaerothrix sp. 4228-RoL]|uniref:Toast rack family protein n=1 Tax=Thermanaerothrix solaris TaxID=3058434 RepID=A0ABU3NM18_9CHLR|nr:toast rack family protein [Thermanaerothrix sp. 4228-RoL]MDT8897400.1 toast rack family protein [Thermanaerothrix sp. 4228-RoL]
MRHTAWMFTRSLVLLTGLLLITSLACSITVDLPNLRVPTMQVTTPKVITIDEPLPAGTTQPIRLRLEMGMGELRLQAGAEGLIEGSIRYNLPEWEPQILRGENALTLTQRQTEGQLAFPKDTINEWDLKLGNYPLDLSINAGAYKGELDLSGVPLTRLQISDGASEARVIFNTPNPLPMEQLRYRTGASKVELVGLGNTKAAEIVFEGGTGAYTLDFSGDLSQDTKVQIKSGVSQVVLIIPEETPARVEITGGLNNITPQGTWSIRDGVYEKSGSGARLLIEIQMGVGSLELKVK